MSHSVNAYRDPTLRELETLTLGFHPSKVFDDDAILDLVDDAQNVIFGEFYHAKELIRGDWYDSDNRIIGVVRESKKLLEYVIKNTKLKIIERKDLTDRLQELPPEFTDEIVEQIEAKLLSSALQDMLNRGEIWYDKTSPGAWSAVQSGVDRYREWRYGTNRRNIHFRDDRHHHGHPGCHRDRNLISA